MDILKSEYIGLPIEVAQASNKDLEGMKGTVVDETKHSFRIKTSKNLKTVLKKGAVFKIKDQLINGDKIEKRPEERIK